MREIGGQSICGCYMYLEISHDKISNSSQYPHYTSIKLTSERRRANNGNKLIIFCCTCGSYLKFGLFKLINQETLPRYYSDLPHKCYYLVIFN